MDMLIMAVTAFVGTHLLMSIQPVRAPLIAAMGKGVFRIVYSVVSLVTFVWMIRAYGSAPYIELYDLGPGGRHAAMLVMLIATFFIANGYAKIRQNPTGVVGEKTASSTDPQTGIMTITRHPIMVGVTIWAIAHLLANGDQAAVVLCVGMAILAIGGAHNIDLKVQRRRGSDWGPMALTTSHAPFLAALQGRTKIDKSAFGVRPLALTVVIYALLLIFHQFFAGVPLVHLF